MNNDNLNIHQPPQQDVNLNVGNNPPPIPPRPPRALQPQANPPLAPPNQAAKPKSMGRKILSFASRHKGVMVAIAGAGLFVSALILGGVLMGTGGLTVPLFAVVTTLGITGAVALTISPLFEGSSEKSDKPIAEADVAAKPDGYLKRLGDAASSTAGWIMRGIGDLSDKVRRHAPTREYDY